MADSVREFFETLETRLDPAKTRGTKATYRFDIAGAGSWRVAVDDGHVSVAESQDAADCAIRMKEDVFVKLLRGGNPMTAFMMGRIKVDGDMSLALKLKDLFF
jgi:putative sterol carrier protein